MEALSLIMSVQLVADEVRHSTSGYDEVRRTADEVLRVQQRRRRVFGKRRAGRATEIKEVVQRPRLVAESSGD